MTTIVLAYVAAGAALLLWVNLAQRFRRETFRAFREMWRESPVAMFFGIVSASIVFVVSWPLWLALTWLGKDSDD